MVCLDFKTSLETFRRLTRDHDIARYPACLSVLRVKITDVFMFALLEEFTSKDKLVFMEHYNKVRVYSVQTLNIIELVFPSQRSATAAERFNF